MVSKPNFDSSLTLNGFSNHQSEEKIGTNMAVDSKM
jgi:hypothetical protein